MIGPSIASKYQKTTVCEDLSRTSYRRLMWILTAVFGTMGAILVALGLSLMSDSVICDFLRTLLIRLSRSSWISNNDISTVSNGAKIISLLTGENDQATAVPGASEQDDPISAPLSMHSNEKQSNNTALRTCCDVLVTTLAAMGLDKHLNQPINEEDRRRLQYAFSPYHKGSVDTMPIARYRCSAKIVS